MTTSTHPAEPHSGEISGRLNWLRAGVLGANDGIVSVAALVVGVAGATTSTAAVLTAGVAGVVGGAVSMALGEYVSVSSQSDSQRALIAKERAELAEFPDVEVIIHPDPDDLVSQEAHASDEVLSRVDQ